MRVRAALVLVVVLTAAGCTSAAVESSAPTASPTSVATPSPAPTPTATPTPEPVLEQSDAELGIVLENVPAALAGAQVDVYNVAAAYQKEYWRMMRTSTAGPGFDALVAPEMRAKMQRIAAGSAEQQLTLGGVFRTSITDVVVDGDSATVRVCDDYRDVTATYPDGTYSSQEVGLDGSVEQLTLGPSGEGAWLILDSTPAGDC